MHVTLIYILMYLLLLYNIRMQLSTSSVINSRNVRKNDLIIRYYSELYFFLMQINYTYCSEDDSVASFSSGIFTLLAKNIIKADSIHIKNNTIQQCN